MMPLGKDKFTIVHLICAPDTKDNFTKGHSSSRMLSAESSTFPDK